MNELRLAVCDDETVDLTHIMQMLADYTSRPCFDIKVYTKARDLLGEKFDIVLLDIEMEPPTGFEIAKILIAQESPPVILFTTKSNAYTLKGYGIALRYLQKPLNQQELFEALDAAVSEANTHRLTIAADDATYAIYLREILYIEVIGHYSVIHIRNGAPIKLRKSLKELLMQIPQRCFGIAHKSFVVNFDYIQHATKSEVSLTDGTQIPISRSKSKEFEQAFHRYLGR